jgi:vitamin B12 transporter
MPVYAFLFLLLAFPSEVLKGTILDTSGAAVAGARVEISGRPSFAVFTDGTGQFIINEIPIGTYELRVTATGFTPLVSSVEVPSEKVNLTLRVAPRTDDVIVTTTRFETPLSSLGLSATVIDHDEIRQRQAPSIYELLRNVPGLSVANTSRRGGTTSVYTRGGGKNGNLVLIDGLQINDPGGDFNFAHLTATNLERIEIVRGPQSASYGANAAASVIQLVSRQGKPEDGPASGFSSFEGGTFETYRYGTGISGALKTFDYSIAAEHLRTAGAYTNDRYRNLTFAGNFGYRISELSQLRMTMRTVSLRVGVPNRVAYGLLDTDARRTGSNLIGGVRYERNGRTFSQQIQLGATRFRDYFRDDVTQGPFEIGAIVSGTAGARGRAGVRLVRFLSSADLALSRFTIPSGAQLIRRTIRLNAAVPSNLITGRGSAEYQGHWNYSGQRSFVFGYGFEREHGSADASSPFRNTHGLFANHQHNIGTRLFLTESVRFENNSAFHNKVVPRFAASYLLTPATRLKLSGGTGISEPSLRQNFANDPAFVGNRDLRPERSRSVEAGVQQHLLGSALVIDATVFKNSFRDLIVFTSLAPPRQSTWVNLERSRAQGFEWSASLRAAWLQMHADYTFLDTRVMEAAAPASATTGVGQELPRRPRHSGSIDVTASFRRGFINLNTKFVGERHDSDGVGFGIVRNPRYQRMDLGGSYTIHPSIDLQARVDNLLNHRYEEVLGYTALARNALIGMNVRWGKK